MFRVRSRLAIAFAAAFLGFPAASFAATYTVNTTADNPPNSTECSGVPGDCSLRQALDKATSGDTVSVPANASAYQLTSRISIVAAVSIVGGGASGTTVSGRGANQIFEVNAPTSGSVSISAITLTDGFNNSGGDEAGAVNVDSGNLTLDQVAITNSTSPLWGGGIEDFGGNLTITRSRFSGNKAEGESGGAIDFGGFALSISDSVFANNTAKFDAGAVFHEGGPSADFNRVTFEGNSAGSNGGAVDVDDNATTVYNATFTGNSAGNGGALATFVGIS